TRYLTCHLFHLPDPCCDFQLYGFVVSSEKCMSVPDDNDWRPRIIEAGSMDSGHHRVSLNITYTQRVGEDRVDPEDLYGIPERLQHSRIVSRVVDTPHRYNGSRQRDTSKQPDQRHLLRSEGRLQVPQSPLDNVAANTSKVVVFPGTSPITVISHLSEQCSHVSQSTPDELDGTQKLPAAERPHRFVRLSKHTVQRLQEKGAPRWKVTDNKEHVHCQCNFNRKEGNMLRQLEDLVLVRRCLWILYGPKAPSTQAQLKRRLNMKDEDDVAKLVHRLKEEGFLKSVKGHKLIAAESPSQVEKKERLYGNPMSFISDCYDGRINVSGSHQ
ncbi:MAG: hypothetical protein Q9204_003933, partial [Flavoplaca sp. TL-2023a]